MSEYNGLSASRTAFENNISIRLFHRFSLIGDSFYLKIRKGNIHFLALQFFVIVVRNDIYCYLPIFYSLCLLGIHQNIVP